MSVESKILEINQKYEFDIHIDEKQQLRKIWVKILQELFINTKVQKLSTFKTKIREAIKKMNIQHPELKIPGDYINCIHAFITSDFVQHYRNSENALKLANAFEPLFGYLFNAQRKRVYNKGVITYPHHIVKNHFTEYLIFNFCFSSNTNSLTFADIELFENYIKCLEPINPSEGIIQKLYTYNGCIYHVFSNGTKIYISTRP